MSQNLRQYSFNRYSQNGEDGIIEELCRRLEWKSGWCVEFGAWDGKHLSNTYNLLCQGWKAVHIEGDQGRFQDLLRTKAAFPDRLHPLCAMVEIQGPNRLDNLLAQTPVPREFELLSIDIDSYDWEVWNSLVNYTPKLVVIECNSALPPAV